METRNSPFENQLKGLGERYQKKFSNSIPGIPEDTSFTLIHQFFGNCLNSVSRGNYFTPQFKNRHLGGFWESLLRVIYENSPQVNYSPQIKEGKKQLADFQVNDTAIEAKYRFSSGDWSTVSNISKSGIKLREELNLTPVMLICCDFNNPKSISTFKQNHWEVLTGEECYDYILRTTDFNLKAWLEQNKYAP